MHVYIYLYLYIYMAQVGNPTPPSPRSWSCMYAVCRRLYVRFGLHTPSPLWDGWGLGSGYDAPCPAYGMGRCYGGTMYNVDSL